ncbi:TonB-dependent receptor [Pseudoalteromonas sp. MMG013]|uniref:TonB-dependent receptor n=1 Tax=Pseudoalteromonas sp. MMG013 TaxID=2822687 RepID=UPI001B385EC3|nr:TonB-dependent receptor [Pseudoalteromonas sp. MMG013]MBQ4863014.1 TonB-dependent receptor [Pseudoalteromonas sp. MMG013]
MKLQKPSNFTYTKLALATAGVLFTAQSYANTLQGRISDHDQAVYFEGAKVTIKELSRSVSSARDGSFRLANLPEGEYTLVVNYLGAPPVERTVRIHQGETLNTHIQLGTGDALLEDVLVVGHRAGQAGALNRQKNALGIKSIVSSDAIGQLPDQNAAEALQRLPGMFIQRDQGEGRFVGIRGIDPSLNNVTINGANVPSPESGVRSVAMDVIPSELVQSLEVSKTVTPDMDASAIGGSIEVKSLSAFDRQGQSYSFTAQATHNKQVDKTSPKVSGSFTDVFTLSKQFDLGVATALSWSERQFGSHNMETDGGWQMLDVEDTAGQSVSLFGAEEIEQRHYVIKRERLGAALNLDLHSSQLSKYYFRSLFSEFSDDEFRLRNEYKFAKGTLVAGSNTSTAAVYSGAEMDRDTKDRYESQTIMSVVLGAEHQFSDWFVEYSLGYSKSSEEEPNRIDADFAGEDLTLGYGSLGDTPTLSRTEAAHDLNLFALDEVVRENNNTEDESTSFKIDLSREFTIAGFNSELKFGAKYSERDKFNDTQTTIFDGGFDDTTALQFATVAPEYHSGDFGPGLSRDSIAQFVMQNHQQFDINQQDTDIDSKGKSYQITEEVVGAYVMMTLDMGRWQLISGLRYEGTDFSTSGNKVELIKDEVADSERVDITAWHAQKDYHHVMPNLTARYDVSEQVLTRFAYTNTIARPSFSDSSAFQIVETETTQEDTGIVIERQAEVGNPQLDPYESHNLDVSIEYYPGKVGVISAGLFYKDIDNFISVEQVQDNGQWQGYKKVTQAVNGGAASLRGIELAYTKHFENGVMFSANGTFIDADDALPNQSDTVANIMLGYESTTLSTRLSASYKSKSFMFEEGNARVLQDDHLQLDFSAKYYVTDQTQLYFNAVNLTDEPYYAYHGTAQYNYQSESYGRSFEFGFTLTSL